MAQFRYKSVKAMEPRPGQSFSTEYYKQSQSEYKKLQQHVTKTMEDIVVAAAETQQVEVLEQPLKGFPRTGGKENYSAWEIINDLDEQLRRGKDVPSGILGRWQRLFKEFPEHNIEMIEEEKEKNTFNSVFVAD